MQEITVVENGLIIPEGTSDEALEAFGSTVGAAYNSAQRTLIQCQWALGDWFNGIPVERRRAACKKFSVPYSTASQVASVTKQYAPVDGFFHEKNLPERSLKLNWSLHQVAAQGTTHEECEELIKWATAGIEEPKGTFRNPLKREMVVHRDHLLERTRPVVARMPEAASIDAVLDRLPKATSKVAKREVKRVLNVLHAEFKTEVDAQVNAQVVDVRHQQQANEVRHREIEEQLSNRAQNIAFFMTEEEFNIVRGCLHPDREASVDSKTKAFAIFNRLKDGLGKNPVWASNG
jgi:hypothetical protein